MWERDTMDLHTAISERRSVRLYENRPIPQEILDRILEAALMAPSAVNLQPWYFVVIQSESAMDKLKTVMATASSKILPNLERRFPNHPEVVQDTCRFIDGLGGAPTCILAFQLRPDYDKGESTIIQSVSAAIENMLLSAWDQGIGSCWLTAPLEAGVDQALKEVFAPEKGDLVALITFGYPTKVPRAPKRREGRYIII